MTDDEFHLGRPIPRGGVSPRGSAIAVVIVLVGLGCLVGFIFDLWRTLPQVSGFQRGLWVLGVTVQWLALFGAGFYLTLSSGMLYETRRIPSPENREAGKIMLLLTFGSWAGPTVFTAWKRNLYVGLTAAVVSWWLSSVRPLAVLAAVVAFQIWGIVRIATPPAVVFLGTSDAADLEWHWTLLHVARPLRVVSCLNVENAETRAKSRDMTLDCLRCPYEEGWWRSVQLLIRLTPLVLIDATVVTPALEDEARSLLDSELAFKCIALCGPQGERDLLDSVGAPKGLLCAISVNAALHLVTEILSRGDFPTPSRPVSRIAAEINPWLPGFMEQAEASGNPDDSNDPQER
ncbi:MAG TPA: hypothetical protein VMW27_15055 [Thermoanaerobaculia bacterium]|nr:hypothetical protein [Thermoanaerobaculia bacterium]